VEHGDRLRRRGSAAGADLRRDTKDIF
jgi:hypothetical protein